MSKKIQDTIKYVKKNYNAKGFTEHNTITDSLNFEQIFADSLLSSYPSSTDSNHVLQDGIYLDSIPSHVRNDIGELQMEVFRKERDDPDTAFLQPYTALPSNEKLYYNSILAYSYTNHNLLTEGLAKFLDLKDFIVHRTAETDPFEESNIGYFNKIEFHRIEVDQTLLQHALYSKAEKNIDKVKTVLNDGKRINEVYHYKIYPNDFPTFLYALKCSNEKPIIKSTKLFDVVGTKLGREFYSVFVDSANIESLNTFIEDVIETSEVKSVGNYNELNDFS